MPQPLRYTLYADAPHTHRFRVDVHVAAPDPAGQELMLPAWIPGSYMIRDFAKNVVALSARAADGQALSVDKLDKDHWRCAPCVGALTVSLEIHALDLSVRTAYLDTRRAYFNGTALFPRLPQQADQPCELEIRLPQGAEYARWRVATALPALDVDGAGAGLYRAADYDELVDSPVEIGEQLRAQFIACDVPHEIVITGQVRVDLDRLSRDLKAICEQHIRFFGEPAPMSRYVFLVLAVGDGYGGLEHRASTSLICRRDDLPQPGDSGVSEGYRTFLGLCSHEYFHTWNVKRIRPAAFTPYDYSRENYTRLLWAFEGITSYYDDLGLLRAGLIDIPAWLQLLGETATRVCRGPGRLRQTLADSSFDAWNKFYKPDADTPNAVVSYYAKGALVALALDLTIRRATGGERSLDDVMRALWQRYGCHGIGVPEDGVEAIASEIAGCDLQAFFDLTIRSTAELPLAELLAEFGIDFTLRPAEGASDKGGTPARRTTARADLGLRTGTSGEELRVVHVIDGGAAQMAGLAAGDVLLALDGLRITPRGFEALLDRCPPGEPRTLHFFRRDELSSVTLLPLPAPADSVYCSVSTQPSAPVLERRREWLGG